MPRFKRRTYKKKTKTEKSICKAVKKCIRKEFETKYYYYGLDDTVNYAGDIYDLINPAAGTSSEQRIGARIRLQYLQMRYRIAASAAISEVFRVIIFVYKSKSNSGPNPPIGAPIYSATSTDYFTAMSPYDNKTVGDELYVIYDRLHKLTKDTSNNIQCANIKLSLKNIICELDSTGYGTNKIYMSVYGQSVNTNGFQFYSRIAYKDA